jgi:hypothetical protein
MVDEIKDTSGGDLGSLTLLPLIFEGSLANVRVEFQGSPGLFLSLTANAAAELWAALGQLLATTDWRTYALEHGWVGPQPVVTDARCERCGGPEGACAIPKTIDDYLEEKISE